MPDRDDISTYIALQTANGWDGNNAANEMERNEAAVRAAMGMDKENQNPLDFATFSDSATEEELCQ